MKKNHKRMILQKKTLLFVCVIIMLYPILVWSNQNPANLVGVYEKIDGDDTWFEGLVLFDDGNGMMVGDTDLNMIRWRVENNLLFLNSYRFNPECDFTLSNSMLSLRPTIDLYSTASYKKLNDTEIEEAFDLRADQAMRLLKNNLSAGKEMFDKQTQNMTRSAIQADLLGYLINIQAFYFSPESHGGSGRKFTTSDYSKMMSFINNGKSGPSITSLNGTYVFSAMAPNGIRIEMNNVPNVPGWTAMAIVAFDGRTGNGFERGFWHYVGPKPARGIPSF